MRSICQIDATGVWTGATDQIADTAGIPSGWVAAVAPSPPGGKVARMVEGAWLFVSPPLLSAVDLAAYAGRKRWETEISGILFDGHPIPTDDRAKALISGAYQKARADAAATKRWQISAAPIVFVTLSNAQLIALGLAAETFVQSTFDTLDTVAAGIAGGTITTTAAIDIAFAALTHVFTTP